MFLAIRVLVVLLLVGRVAWSADLFPKIDGWAKSGKLESFNSTTLFNAINGAAPQYISYGFEALGVQDYTREKLTATVSIYDMKLPINAFGIFSHEQPPKAETFSAGARAVAWAPYQCLMLKDRFYVKIQATKGKLALADCEVLMNALAAGLPGSDQLPAQLSILPKPGQLAGMTRYTKQSYLGLSELNNCLHSKYKTASGQEYSIFTILTEEGKSAADIWAALAKKYEKVPGTKTAFLTKDVPYTGRLVIGLHQAKLIGVVGFEKPEAALAELKRLLAAN
jgi:uncharacterized protein DUF6599